MVSSSKRTQEWINRIAACRRETEIDQVVDEIMRECKSDDPPYLSDLLINTDAGAQPLMMALGDMAAQEIDLPPEQHYRWKLKVLRDEWGNSPGDGLNPGDEIVRKISKGWYKKDGKPWSGYEISKTKQDGSYNDKFIRLVSYKIDEKGCIMCPFRDAVWFLNMHGIHAKTGYSLCRHPEHSVEPTPAPDGNKYHVWYWRFSEMDKHDYSQLSTFKFNKDTKKRGVR